MQKNYFIFIFIFILVNSLALAEEFDLNENNKSSSSFVVDPDPLDPLPQRKESVKDGDEIILDSIKDITDGKVKIPAKIKNKIKNNEPKDQIEITHTKKIKAQTISKKSKKSKNKHLSLKNDEPDLKLESKLHLQFEKFNINPTPEGLWSAASSKQKENVYEVQKHDTLFSISKILFGDSQFWPKIWSLNRGSILNPHYIYPGMKIYFYSGDAETPPTLQTNSVSTVGVSKLKKQNNLSDNYFIQNTEFKKSLTSTVSAAEREKFPTPIPDSLPLTRNNKYFFSNQKSTEIDLKAPIVNFPENYQNPYMLSAVELKSDFEVPKNELNSMICHENQFVSKVNKLTPEGVEGNYAIVKKINTPSDRLIKTFKYKFVGEVNINNEHNLRITNCSDLLDTDTLIIAQEKLNTMVAPNEILNKPAHLVDGFDFMSQDYFAQNQYVIINTEGLNVGEGAVLPVYSEELGKNVGEIKMLQITGSLGVAIVTKVSDVMHRGDLVR